MLIQQIGKIIKERRKDLKITQSNLAELAKISTNTLYKLEKNQGNPSLDTLTKLIEVLGLEVKCEIKVKREIKKG